MDLTLLQQGLLLMLMGMGTVFVFLATLVLAINLMARLVTLLPTSAAPAPVGAANEELAAIAAAIRMHRSRQKSA